MNDVYEAAREIRDAINVLDDTTARRLSDIAVYMRAIRDELRATTACLRDISDVMHAQFYGVKTREQEESGDDEGGS